jgi:hypothetical protein
VVEHFYDKTMSGIQELISDQKKEIMRKHGQAPKVSSTGTTTTTNVADLLEENPSCWWLGFIEIHLQHATRGT